MISCNLLKESKLEIRFFGKKIVKTIPLSPIKVQSNVSSLVNYNLQTTLHTLNCGIIHILLILTVFRDVCVCFFLIV